MGGDGRICTDSKLSLHLKIQWIYYTYIEREMDVAIKDM